MMIDPPNTNLTPGQIKSLKCKKKLYLMMKAVKVFVRYMLCKGS